MHTLLWRGELNVRFTVQYTGGFFNYTKTAVHATSSHLYYGNINFD